MKCSLIVRAILASTVVAMGLAIPCLAGLGASGAALDRVYFFLSKTQSADGGVGAQIRRTSDQALVAAAFLNRGHINRARRALDMLDKIRAADGKTGGFKGFALTYDEALRPVSERVDPFTQAAVAAAAYNYHLSVGGKRYEKLIIALAGLYVSRINARGVVTDFARTPSTTTFVASRPSAPSAVENLCAYYILSVAASATGDEIYLKAAKRLRFALKDLFFDDVRKSFVSSGAAPDSLADILGALLDGPWSPGVSLDLTGDIGRMALSELAVTAQAAAIAAPSKALPPRPSPEPATAMFLCFPPEIPDGAFIGSRDVGSAIGAAGPSPDYFATAVFAFISEKTNPFAIRDEGFQRRMEGVAVERGEMWKSDGFESGEHEFYLAPRDTLRNADVFIGLDEQFKKDGRFSLRAQYAPSKNEKSAASVLRVFYPSQDFSSAGRIRFWLAARPAVFALGATGLKIRARVFDESGAWADSQPLNHSGRGVENTVVCPSGFTPPSGGVKPDYSKIKRIGWMFEEETQTSWNINLDDVRIE
ncbi:MAG: hypothetical protein QME32_03415 [Endomicrobiia bacterium]|nr:hypothetical protein [Endomicrobiia bacterium]